MHSLNFVGKKIINYLFRGCDEQDPYSLTRILLW